MNISKTIRENKNNIVVFFLLIACSFIAYRNTFDILVPTDFYPTLYRFEKYGFNAWQYNFFESGVQHFFTHLIFLFLFKIFGASSIGWVGLSVLVHGFNAFLIYKIIIELSQPIVFEKNKLLSLFSCLLFLFSPYQTEAVLWSFGYLYAVCFGLIGILSLIYYLKTTRKQYLIFLHIAFVASLLSFESTIVMPVICFLLYIFFIQFFGKLISFFKFCSLAILPQLIIIFLYFLANKFYSGQWVGHYGSAIHLKISFTLVAVALIKYCAKFFCFYRFFPLETKDFIYNYWHLHINDLYFFCILFTLFALAVGAIIFIVLRKKNPFRNLIFFTFFSFLASLIPVINLDATFINAIHSDRYGYFPSVFFYPLLCFLLYYFLKKLGFICMIGVTALSFVLLSSTIQTWVDASNYSKQLVSNFEPCLSKPNVYILNMPDNFNWVVTFRNGFEETIYFKYHKKITTPKIIAEYYMAGATDSLSVTHSSSNSFIVSSPNIQKTFLRDGIWAKSYETESYSVVFNHELSSYVLTFKDKIPVGATILYVAGDKWKEVNL
jgi:hypothetical protein